MAYSTADKKRALRRELSEAGIHDPFDLLAEALDRCERLQAELTSLRAHGPASPIKRQGCQCLHG